MCRGDVVGCWVSKINVGFPSPPLFLQAQRELSRVGKEEERRKQLTEAADTTQARAESALIMLSKAQRSMQKELERRDAALAEADQAEVRRHPGDCVLGC